MPSKLSWTRSIKEFFLGKALNPTDHNIFHQISLIPFFAWVGLGADGLSSACYGPEEAFLALGQHTHLALFVAMGTVITIFVISSSYSQIIELFPTGGGGYLVASKLLNPLMGMISGCALLIDYVLTITISIASGADALFSFLPGYLSEYKLIFALFGIALITFINLRGVKESVMPLVPIFMVFIITHLFGILYIIFTRWDNIPVVLNRTNADVHNTISEVGIMGLLFIIIRAYSLGAGTFTGIEAVSNGLPILREPKVVTGKLTMKYMAVSLSIAVFGLVLSYLLLNVTHTHGKTLNAVLFMTMVNQWDYSWGNAFVWITLFSEAMILFVAAQAGFLDGPRVLANMAVDRWFPTRFIVLSDRFVNQNGILIMGLFAMILMFLSNGSVRLLVVFYSINVFITFGLSQAGMVRHWWQERRREPTWIKKLAVNGIGLTLSLSILISVVILKFYEGGWITILVTSSLAFIAYAIRYHYLNTMQMLKRLDNLVEAAMVSCPPIPDHQEVESIPADPDAKTAVMIVSGFNGLGLHTLFGVIRLFGGIFKNFVFIQIGIVDAENFKSTAEVEKLNQHIHSDIKRYQTLLSQNGLHSEGFVTIANSVMHGLIDITPHLLEKYPNAVIFGGQLVFPNESLLHRMLHNFTVFSIQRYFYRQGVPMVIIPIRV